MSVQRFRSSSARLPVLFSCPHSGRTYPSWLVRSVACSSAELRALEDGPLDCLLGKAVEAGAMVLLPTYPRAVVDLNREPGELDPALVRGSEPHAAGASLRARSGLGIIPSRLHGRLLYRQALRPLDVARRLQLAYRPYHQALRRQLQKERVRAGCVVLFDCHSMPSRLGAERLAQVVIGDARGTSCDAALTSLTRRIFQKAGYRVALNHPYAGGYITVTYGRPLDFRHALQIEIRRDLFMDEDAHTLHDGARDLMVVFEELAREAAALLLELGDDAGHGMIAAE